ncbi:NAD(P)H-dependent oxidoreductase [Solirubrobacter sp. CPCC 204708]|uniref:NAD(P)H-dependent oxidoreductase n=1 Tax=Solirubrobacter deserti TaxID=2282478 RepID=A0ABT4RGP4_9ACTN|nr:NAD(P)H-dependent oxidoreductase [Solirubrobacter deserti]MBE2315450.1 NAD(P)H-dependent oxidoreductase [Solirubrobacter deserti]MDA0137708.1 NAD(P)H-dependent oxidoreductase [Solirubrobacter deserti]
MPFLVGLGGTMRFGSSNERALKIAMEHAAGLGAETLLITGARLDLPTYDPALDPNAAAQYVIDAVERADGLILASPSYHGGMTGLLKNALDHLEALRDRPRPYLRDRPVGLIATGDGWQGPNATLQALRLTVHALQGWPTPLGIAHNVVDEGVDAARPQLRLVAEQVLDFAQARVAAVA